MEKRTNKTDTLDKQLKSVKQQLAVKDETLSKWQSVFEEFQTPQEVKTLVSKIAEAEQREEQYRHQVQVLEETLVKSDKEVHKEVLSLREKYSESQQEMERAQQNYEQIKEELRIVREKGNNPPCWYKTVPAERGGMRERPYYTFHIAVLDDAIIVRQALVPPGNAADDNGLPYADEAKQLKLDDIPYETILSNERLIEYMKPVHEAGKNAKVRSYSCTFFVKVWDKTSDKNKKRWKEAHRLLNDLFGIYIVQDDPWPQVPNSSTGEVDWLKNKPMKS